MSNPLLSEWNTPHGVAPFDAIKPEHFLPAFETALARLHADLDAIADTDDTPTFENTIAAFEAAGADLGRILPVLSSIGNSNSNDEIRAAQSTISPKLAAINAAIYTRKDLFDRIEAVRQSDLSALTPEQQMLLSSIHNDFVRAGAALDDDAKARVAAIDEELASLSTEFGQSLVREASGFALVLESEDELAGLPQSVRDTAAAEAESRGQSGKFAFTTSRSSFTPFMQYAERRDLREKLWQAYTTQGDRNNEFDNKDRAKQIAALRAERARIMGFPSHAHFILDDRMASKPEHVIDLLDRVRKPADAKVREEAEKLQERIQAQGGNFTLAPWDWWFYTEQRRADEFDLSQEELKPYFPLEQVRNGAFDVATKLYGITFNQIDGVPGWHEDVEAFEVHDADGSLIGLFMTDFYSRATKRDGAWMNPLRSYSTATHGEKRTPIILNNCNFNKGDPTLLDLDEVRTVFHEFGHGLHGLLSKVNYESLSGTAVKRDFVELPSQIMEHWAYEPSVMQSYARHFETGEPIPDELIEKILATDTFNQGFATTEYLAASYLDMHWHQNGAEADGPVEDIEKTAMDAIGLIDEIAPRYRSTYFQHIFSGGYSAGYYSYLWAEVLDSDAYEAFREKGIFDAETAKSFRENVLETGGTVEPMELYRRFRGREPDVEPLLRGRGLA